MSCNSYTLFLCKKKNGISVFSFFMTLPLNISKFAVEPRYNLLNKKTQINIPWVKTSCLPHKRLCLGSSSTLIPGSPAIFGLLYISLNCFPCSSSVVVLLLHRTFVDRTFKMWAGESGLILWRSQSGTLAYALSSHHENRKVHLVLTCMKLEDSQEMGHQTLFFSNQSRFCHPATS